MRLYLCLFRVPILGAKPRFASGDPASSRACKLPLHIVRTNSHLLSGISVKSIRCFTFFETDVSEICKVFKI
jgi:hypothetical protein